MPSLKTTLDALRDALIFVDKVRNASMAEQIAVGTDHWIRLEQAARDVVAAYIRDETEATLADLQARGIQPTMDADELIKLTRGD